MITKKDILAVEGEVLSKKMLDFQSKYNIMCMARLITEKADTLTALPYNYFKGYIQGIAL